MHGPQQTRELRPGDLVAFTLRDEDRELEDSKKSTSWLWEDCSWVGSSEEGMLSDYMKLGENTFRT